jgi:hypothetical protein
MSPTRVKSSVLPKHWVTPTDVNSIVEEEIIQCRKSAYVERTENMDAHWEYYTRNYPTLPFQRGKETVLIQLPGYAVENQGSTNLFQAIMVLRSSGIRGKLKEFYAWKGFLKRLENTRKIVKKHVPPLVSPLKLSQKLQTVFVVYFAILVLLCAFYAVKTSFPLPYSFGTLQLRNCFRRSHKQLNTRVEVKMIATSHTTHATCSRATSSSTGGVVDGTSCSVYII